MLCNSQFLVLEGYGCLVHFYCYYLNATISMEKLVFLSLLKSSGGVINRYFYYTVDGAHKMIDQH